MIKRLERLKNTVNKYMADLRPDRLTTYQSERKLVVIRRPGVLYFSILLHCIVQWVLQVLFPSACSFIVFAAKQSFKHMKRSTWRILHTRRWPCRPKHVVKNSENQIQ
jgi:hypothetical protein